MEVPIVEGRRAQAGFDIFGRSGVLDADELRVDAFANLDGEMEEGAIG